MAKALRKPILAAGGIVVRQGAKPRLAVVRRRRDDAWVLPKGKLKPNERPIAAAKREVREETGCAVRIREFLGVISYRGGGATKVAHFWRMQALGEAGEPMDDISAVKWLSFSAALARLSLAHERQFLRSIGRKALKRAPRRKKSRRKRRNAGGASASGGKKRKAARSLPARGRACAVPLAVERARQQLAELKAAA